MIESDGGDEIASGPESSFWKFFGFLFDPGTGFAFDYCHSIGYRVFGWYGDVHVDVFVSNVPSENSKSLPFADQFEYSFEFSFNVGISQNITSVFGSPNQVILADVCAVAKVIDSCISHN
jgi:hypothetical protein